LAARASAAGFALSACVPVGKELVPLAATKDSEVLRDPEAKRRIVVIDQAERLLPPSLSMEEARREIVRVLEAELEVAKGACVLPGDKPSVVCLMVLRDDDLARSTVLAPVFGLPAFPSSVIYRLSGLDSSQQAGLVAHLSGTDRQRASSWIDQLGWDKRLREFLPLHAKIAADTLRMASAADPAVAAKWGKDSDLLVNYPKLLLEERFGARRARDLLNVCFAMARACWFETRLTGNEQEATRTLGLRSIQRSYRAGFGPPRSLPQRLALLCEAHVTVLAGEDAYEFSHDYFVGAFAEIERSETHAAKRFLFKTSLALSVAMLVIGMAGGVANLWVTRHLRDLESRREKLEESTADLTEKSEALNRKIHDLEAQTQSLQSQVDRARKAVQDLPAPAASQRVDEAGLAAEVDRYVTSRTQLDAILASPDTKANSPLAPAIVRKGLQVRMRVAPTDRRGANGSPLHDVQFWVTGPAELLASISSVRYHFDQPTFVPKTKVGANPQNGFQIHYLGYSCIDKVKVTAVLKGTAKEVVMDYAFCEEWRRQT
jgi:cell division protein FtsB